jgi:hypothetical protein
VRSLLAASVAALAVLVAGSWSAPASADADPGPPYIDHTAWEHWGDLSSLRVYPTSAGREESRHGGPDAQGAEAWSEVLASSPDADMPGMRAQFMCHWAFAEIAQPGKTSWNLEPWRPVVDDQTMVDTRCNPGGTEEPF